MNAVTKGILVALVVFVVGFIAWPSPIDPVSWDPPEPPEMTGALAPNEALLDAELLGQGRIIGPEDTEVDEQGRVYGGLDDGTIVRIDADDNVETFADTGGRPLGMEFDSEGNLIVADAWKGLLSISPDGAVEVLTTEADGVPFAFTDDLDIASDGRIYFSDASERFNQPEYRLDMLEGRPHGRLLRYDPETDETQTLMEDLHFANGIALSADESFVLVNETWRYRIQRYWLDGERAGEAEVFADNLPGFPDNVARDEDGLFWVAIPTKRLSNVDGLHPYPWLKSLVAKLPQWMQPQPEPYGLVLAYDEQGHLLGSLHDPSGEHLRMITSVKPRQGALHFGSLYNDRIGRLDRDRALQALQQEAQ